MPKHAIGYGSATARVRTLEFLGAQTEIVVKINGTIVTDYVLACRTERGKDEELAQASAGVCELTMDNFGGDFAPENTGGAFYGDLFLGAVVEVYETFNSVDWFHFTGKVDTIEPRGEPDDLTAYILAVDGMDDYSGENKICTALRIDTTTDVLLGDVLDAAGDSEARSFDVGIPKLQIAWFHDEVPIDSIRQLEKIEQGFFYIDVDGARVWENRHHRWIGDGLISQHDFEDSVIQFIPQYSKKLVKNFMEISGYSYVPDEWPSKLWSTYTGGDGAPYIPAGGSITLWAKFDKPLYDYTSPVVGVHWDANTNYNKSGSDISTDISLVITAYGQALKMVFTNGGSSGGYLVVPDTPPEEVEKETVLIYGRLYNTSEIAITKDDATSITQYGKRTYSLDLRFQSNIWDMINYAEWLVDRFKDVVPQPTVKLISGTDAPSEEIFAQCLMRKISDRITIKSTRLAIDKDYFIQKIIHDFKLMEGGMVHEVFWVLQEAVDTDLYWLLGIVDRGELGENTYLGF